MSTWETIKFKVAKAFNWFFASIDNHKDGASGRKLTAIAIVALIIQGHQKYLTKENYYDILFLDVCFVCILLGIVTIEQIIKLFAAKSGSFTKEETKTTTTSEQSTTEQSAQN